jgi:hypothetical protein
VFAGSLVNAVLPPIRWEDGEALARRAGSGRESHDSGRLMVLSSSKRLEIENISYIVL